MGRWFVVGIVCVVMTLVGSCQMISSKNKIRQALRSIVKIDVRYVVEQQGLMSSSEMRECVASGFSIAVDKQSKKSYVLTNKHVCDMKGKAQYKMELNGGDVMMATYKASDSFADICLLEVDGIIEPLRLADKNAIQGDRIITMGAPNAAFPMVVDGIVSGYEDVNMKHDDGDSADFEIHFRGQVMSAPIYEGASGSPVLNMDNEVIGVVFAVTDGKEHISYLVPISEVFRFLDRSEYVHMGIN